MSTQRSSARRPRRPGDVRHDPAAIDESEALDDRPSTPAPGRKAALPVLCQDVLLLRARMDCPKCTKRTPAFALMGLPEFETDGADPMMLRRIATLPAPVGKAVREFAGQLWRIDQSRAVKGTHWHSHCEHCGARIGEVVLHGPDGPFRPRLYKDRVAIKARRLTGPFVFDGTKAAPSAAMIGWLNWYLAREGKQQAANRPKRAPARPRAPSKTKSARPAA